MTFLLGEDADHTRMEEMQRQNLERGVFLALTQSERQIGDDSSGCSVCDEVESSDSK